MMSIFPEEYSFEKVMAMLQHYDQSRKKCCSWIYFYERKTKENSKYWWYLRLKSEKQTE